MLLKQMKNILLVSSLLIITSCGSKTQQAQMQGPPPAVAITVADVIATQAIYYDEYPATVTCLERNTASSAGYRICDRYLF
jgi:membrane fusion protein (multidrug efflux system)